LLYFGTFYFAHLGLTCTKQPDIKYLERYKVTLLNNFIGNIQMATIQQRRKIDRERQKRWRKKKLAEGQKQTLVMLGPVAQEVLKREKKRTGEPYVQIINRAIIGLKDKLPQVPKSVRKKREQEAIPDLIPKIDSKGKNHSQTSKHLNDEDIPTLSGKGKWFPQN
jgi:hypothetical protein